MRRFALLLIPALFLPAVSGQGAESQAGRTPVNPQNVVTVTRKLISVIVTDKQGRPVTDLRREEFSLTDNGRAVEITEFENHTMAMPAAAPRPSESVIETPVPKAPLLNRSFFFLFDLVFSDPGGLRLARQKALQFFDRYLDPADRIAVLSFTGGRSLHVLHPPDRDREAARRAIQSIRLADQQPVAPIRPVTIDEDALMASGDPMASGFRRSRSADLGVGRIVAGNFIWALDALAQAIRYAPERKLIVLCSNGVNPKYLGRGQDALVIGNSDLGSEYDRVGRNLASSGASVFPVDTEENTFFIQSTRTGRANTGVASLRGIAAETGGRYMGNLYAAEDPMGAVDALTASYYVLGYPITENWDGRFHKIRVKVTRPGCDVDAQSGYFSEKPFSKYSELEKQIHLVDLALSEEPLFQEPVRLPMTALPVAGGPPDDIQVIARIPAGSLEDVAGPRVEAVTLAFDRLDRVVDTRRVEMDLSVGSSTAGEAFFASVVSAPPGDYRCRVVLRNMETGRAAVAGASTAVIAPGNGILLYPPLFLVPGSSMVFLEDAASRGPRAGDEGAPGKAAQGFARAFLAGDGAFAPNIGDTIRGGSDAFASIRCAGVDKAASLSISAGLSNAAGQAYETRASVVSEKPDRGGRVILLRIGMPRIPAGPYRLEMAARSSPDGASSRVIKSVIVE